ncbi:MAG: hypothetical protein WCS77_05695 [Elusimicrobiaceae bacterium]
MISFKSNKGSVLLQAIVLSVIMAMIAVLTLKWTLSRRSDVVRSRNSVEAKTYIEYCMAQKQLEWSLPSAKVESGKCTFKTGETTITVNVDVDTLPDGTNEVNYDLETGSLPPSK